MRIIAKRTLREFWLRHPDARGPLAAWYQEVRHAVWKSPNAVKAQIGSASIIKGCRVVFNVGGNKYRLVVKINYSYEIVFIRFVGTHRQYDLIDAETV
jgi:mRNA interferase HigB